MSNDDHWITTRIEEARTGHPLVTVAVSSRMAAELEGHLSTQPLTQSDLSKLATGLIADMVPKPTKKDSQR